MLQQEISLTEMIQYLAGSASDTLRNHIDLLKQTDSEFAEELEEWKAQMEDYESPEVALAHFSTINEAWQETQPELPELGNEEAKARPLYEAPVRRLSPTQGLKKTPIWYGAIGIAAAIALLLFVIPPMMNTNGGVDYQQQALAEVHAGIDDLIGVSMGSEEDFDRMMRKRIDAGAIEEAQLSLDSLLMEQPENGKYQQLKGSLLVLGGDTELAIAHLESLLKAGSLTSDAFCRVNWQLIMIEFLSKNEQGFEQRATNWMNPNSEIPCAALNETQNKQLADMRQSLR